MATGPVGPVAKRMQQAVEKGEDSHKMRAILEMASKEDLMAWTDESGLDLLHYCILQGNAEATDFLLKQGYFARPYQPQFSLYLHLATFLGHRTILTVLFQHRPDDFRVAKQPLLVPPGFMLATSLTATSARPLSPNPKDTLASPTSPDPSVNSKLLSLASAKSSKTAGGSALKKSPDVSFTSYGTSLKPQPSPFSKASRSPKGSSKSSRSDSLDEFQLPLPPPLETDGSCPLLLDPLDVAAHARKLDCLHTLLDMCVLKANPDTPSKGYLTLAALADCPYALALIIKSEILSKHNSKRQREKKTLVEDYRVAVENCVQRARPECLDLLLGNVPDSVDTKSFFKQINYFHVLYTFSSSYNKGSYGRLPEVTCVLIRRGHDVNARVPPRTYPLYTLLTHSFCFHDYSNTHHYVECLRLLLKNGADPNFDEVLFEKRLLQEKGIKFVAGRNAYASALHCLIETVETYASQLSSKALAVRFVEDCAEVLISYNADVGKVGRIGDARSELQGNVLHQYAKSCVTLGLDKPILQCILRFGAEPDVKVQGKYPINVYFDKLFEMMSLCEVVDARHQYENDVRTMMAVLCGYMSNVHIKEAALVFKRTHGRCLSEQVKYYIESVLNDFNKRSKEIKSLQSLASWRLWKLCGKCPETVRNLPIKVELKTMILPML